MTRREAFAALDEAATEIMTGTKRSGVAIGNAILTARFALMDNGEQDTDYRETTEALDAVGITVAEAAKQLGAAAPTVTKHARKLRIGQRVHGYLFTNADMEALRESMATSRPGRPRKI